jgi:phosphoacetylglucosamine mutase
MDIDPKATATVFIARDTRPSSKKLCDLLREGALAVFADVVDLGLMSTPQLHHVTRMFNKDVKEWASETGYFSMLTEGYKAVLGDVAADPEGRGKLLIDGERRSQSGVC